MLRIHTQHTGRYDADADLASAAVSNLTANIVNRTNKLRRDIAHVKHAQNAGTEYVKHTGGGVNYHRGRGRHRRRRLLPQQQSGIRDGAGYARVARMHRRAGGVHCGIYISPPAIAANLGSVVDSRVWPIEMR
ncbi:hypothetical protein CYMTET_3998 [Cymbomonas tetramitiformis]|uniref:Uncharacterized protein n=1 Tax=Cymbomonas tetramitiformis TaxID=36881 RepID=A0AAE0H215_9CHLO|nr:hypothetical protein CYMTET_3998 [Cymbomonas tetramitiformis]